MGLWSGEPKKGKHIKTHIHKNVLLETYMRNAGLEEAQAGIQIAGRNINNLRCRGPAPVDPGNSKGGRRWRGKTCLFINIRLD